MKWTAVMFGPVWDHRAPLGPLVLTQNLDVRLVPKVGNGPWNFGRFFSGTSSLQHEILGFVLFSLACFHGHHPHRCLMKMIQRGRLVGCWHGGPSPTEDDTPWEGGTFQLEVMRSHLRSVWVITLYLWRTNMGALQNYRPTKVDGLGGDVCRLHPPSMVAGEPRPSYGRLIPHGNFLSLRGIAITTQ